MKQVLRKYCLCILTFFCLAGTATAGDVQIGFHYDAQANAVYRIHPQKGCLITDESNGDCTALSYRIKPQVRILLVSVEPGKSSLLSRYTLLNPFLIVDGINISNTERPLISGSMKNDSLGFYEEIQSLNSKNNEKKAAGNLLGGLTELQYTPILVQFTRTTYNSLEYNSKIFAALLRYLSRPFTQKSYVGMNASSSTGFNILGISQGGVIARYGAWLYDTQRNNAEVPVRLYLSLDSPHQGAVLPRGLLASVDFWGRQMSKPDAKKFLDLVMAPGARDLLLYGITPRSDTLRSVIRTLCDPLASKGEPQCRKDTVVVNPPFVSQLKGDVWWSASAERWLFKDYRRAANYQGFPAVLISNGQLDGQDNFLGAASYLHLNRWSEKGGSVWGRAVSKLDYSTSEHKTYAYNRAYEYKSYDYSATHKGSTRWDMVQGSTYPFFNAIHASFNTAFMEAIPDRDDICMAEISGTCLNRWRFYGKWDAQTLGQDSATFIPTTSSLDLLCDGDLSVRKECAFSQTSAEIHWENPGNRSTAQAIYAVDPSHPRSQNANSGRHVIEATSTLDLWRLFCEVAKHDYDRQSGIFRNRALNGHFDPEASCKDQSTISPWFLQTVATPVFSSQYTFPWARWTFNTSRVDRQYPVNFTLPAGWQIAGLLNQEQSFQACDVIDVTIQTQTPFHGNWLRMEMVLSTGKGGAGWWQLSEQSVPVDGEKHTLRWQLPCSESAIKGYRWARLIMNSPGGNVTVSSVYITNADLERWNPDPITGPEIYPENGYTWAFGSWGNHNEDYKDFRGSGLALNMPAAGDGAYWFLNDYHDVSAYSELKITYWPGTCQATRLYFDKRDRKYNAASGNYSTNSVLLSDGSTDGYFQSKVIPLSAVIDPEATPGKTWSVQRFYLQTVSAAQTCIIRSIEFQ